jgi:hypothetical protein
MRKTCLLLLVCAAAAAEEPDSAKAWEQLDRKYKTAEREFYQPWKDAKARGESCELDYRKHPSRTFVPRFLDFAAKYPGTDEAVKALVQVIRYTHDGDQRTAAVATLMEGYAESEAIRPAIGILRFRAPETLDTLIEKTPHRDIKGFAMLARAQGLKRTDPDRALRMLEDIKRKYTDVVERGTTLAYRAEREIFELVNLAVGKPAPEIEGEDLDGVSFKLSDYRGKVVMLDFWGDW